MARLAFPVEKKPCGAWRKEGISPELFTTAGAATGPGREVPRPDSPRGQAQPAEGATCAPIGVTTGHRKNFGSRWSGTPGVRSTTSLR